MNTDTTGTGFRLLIVFRERPIAVAGLGLDRALVDSCEGLATRVLEVRDLAIFVIGLHLVQLVLIKGLLNVDTEFLLLLSHQLGCIVGLELPGGETSLVHLMYRGNA